MSNDNQYSGFRRFMIKLNRFFRDLAERIRETDKRLLAMVGAAFVLLVIIISLIAHGVK